MADAADSKSAEGHPSCRFESDLGHHLFMRRKQAVKRISPRERLRMPAMRIRSFLFAVLIPLVATAAPVTDRDHEARGGRHYILQAQHVLSDAERASLASEGVTIQRGLPEGRYLVRVASGSAFDDSDPRVRMLAPMTVADKLQRSAYKAASRGLAFARLKVLFHEDIAIEDAIDAVMSAGGTVERPLSTEFGPLRSLTVQLPSDSLQQFAADERVMLVYGALPHH